jgi:hypothetical protein
MRMMNDLAGPAAPGISNAEAVAFVETMLDHGYILPSQLVELIRIHQAAAQPSLPRDLLQNSPYSSTQNPTTTLSLWSDIGTSAEMSTNNMDWQSSATPSASNPYFNSGVQASSLSYLSNHAATPSFPPGASRAPPTLLMPTPTAVAVYPVLLPNLHCGPGHDGQLEKFTVVADTNSPPRAQDLSKSSASFGQSHSTGHGQDPAVQAGVTNAPDPWSASVSASQIHSAHMALKRKASKQNWKSGNCARCPATQSPLWRRDPETKKQQLCNACGQKARAEQKKQKRREQEYNACVAGFSWMIRC